MANESGHTRNVQNFETLISFVTGYGAAYAPTNSAISLASLTSRLADAKAAMDSVTTTLIPSKNAINSRETAFEPLKKLTTRILNYYKSTGAAANKVADLETFTRKIQGTRKSTPVADDPNTPEDESAASYSASQQSYTKLVEHLDNLIEFIDADSLYDPAEVPLQFATLNTLSADLKARNTAVINAHTPLSNARLSRNTIMYDKAEGMVAVAGLVKLYVKAVFGTGSPEYNQISSLRFTYIKP